MFTLLKNLFSNNINEDPKEKYSLAAIQNFVEENINNVISSTIDELGKSYYEIRQIRRRKEIFKTQLNLCGLGDIASKEYIKSWISDLITQKYNVNADNIHYAINFDHPTAYDKFCIILYEYFKEYRYDALKKLIFNYKLDQLKQIEDEEMFAITEEDIDDVFDKEFIDTTKLKFYEKLDILVQRIYENIQGLSVIDDIRDMNCDGISIGVSGVPIDFAVKISDMNIKSGEFKKYPMSYDSVWLYLNGKEIAMQFMTFGSQRQLERVCRKLYRFNNQKQFTQSDGYIFNNMGDFSRIAVFRPPYSESWAAFIRKFDIDGDLDILITHENADIVKELISYIMKANQNMCFTGNQGAGKTTMLVGAIKKIYAYRTIRCYESYFETFLRIKTCRRNILTIRETEQIKGEEGLDSIKKSNGDVNIISESADDMSKAYVIKGALAASKAVYWTDHSVSEDELVQTHRNALLNIGLFRDESLAEEQVLTVLKWNTHLINDEEYGERYIGRLTEFIRLDKEDYVKDNSTGAFNENARKFFERRTNSKKYKTSNIIEFDKENRRYVVTNEISEEKQQQILSNLRKKDKEGFIKLLERMKEEVNRCSI